jgi:hypothetical protein
MGSVAIAPAATGMRFEIAMRLAPFLHAIMYDWPKEHSLVLGGSWANSEYHARAESGAIVSYSDVDMISTRRLSPDEVHQVCGRVHDVAAGVGLSFRGVSVSLARDIKRLLAMRRRDGSASTISPESEFLMFWSLIDAAKAILMAREPTEDLCDMRSYAANKWYLHLWRDLAVIMGLRPSSYRDVMKFATRHISTSAAQASYAIKLGSPGVAWRDLHGIHENAACFVASRFPKTPSQLELLRYLASLDWLLGPRWLAPLSARTALEFLDLAARFDGKVPMRHTTILEVLAWARR